MIMMVFPKTETELMGPAVSSEFHFAPKFHSLRTVYILVLRPMKLAS